MPDRPKKIDPRHGPSTHTVDEGLEGAIFEDESDDLEKERTASRHTDRASNTPSRTPERP